MTLEMRYLPSPRIPIFRRWGDEWRRWGSYRTEAEAEKVAADMRRKRPDWYEFRIASPSTPAPHP